MSFAEYLALTWFERFAHQDELSAFIERANEAGAVSPKDTRR